MRLPIALLLFFAALLIPPLSLGAEEEGPTPEEVMAALADYGTGLEDGPGRARMRAWGDRALEHLEAVAGRDEMGIEGFAIPKALCDVGSERAADLCVRILENRTRVPAFAALSALTDLPPDAPFRRYLEAHPRFQRAVLSHAEGTWRTRVPQLCAIFGWDPQLPLLRRMLEDPDLDVRESAAAAIEALTGEDVLARRLPSRFPATRLRPGLLGDPLPLPHRGGLPPFPARPMTWFDGRPCLVFGWTGDPGRGPVWEVRRLDAPPRAWTPSSAILDARMLPALGGGRQLVGLGLDESGGHRVVALDAKGRERWLWRLPGGEGGSLTTLYEREGPVGVAVGPDEEGIVALDLEGKVLWRVPEVAVVTHPATPGYLLALGGDAVLYRHRGEVAERLGEKPLPDSGYVTSGLLLPAGEGGPDVLLAGVAHRTGVPFLERRDAMGVPAWKATFSHPIGLLRLLELPGHGALVLATTDDGGLHVLDVEGTLLWEGKMPDIEAGEDTAAYALEAGEVAPGRPVVIVQRAESGYRYPVHPDALAGPR